MKRRTCLSALALVAGGQATGPGWAKSLQTVQAAQVIPAAPTAQSASTRRLRMTLTFLNPHQRPLSNQRFWCYLPAHFPPAQALRQVQISSPHSILEDRFGHRILALEWAEVAPLAQRVVSVGFELAGNDDADAEHLPDPQQWLGAERYIETADARMVQAATRLHRATPVETARAIFDWVQQHMQYAGFVADDLGARHALTSASGDCTEYAYLVVALARVLGIPARMAGGYVQDQDAILRAQDYHNWAELHLDGRWCIIDAQKGNWLAARTQYVAFRFYRDQVVNPVGLAHRYRQEGDLQVNL